MPGLGLGLRTAVLTRFPAQKYKKYEHHFGLVFLCWGLQSDCVPHCILAIVDPMRIDSVSRAENAIHYLESQGLLLNVFDHLEGSYAALVSANPGVLSLSRLDHCLWSSEGLLFLC